MALFESLTASSSPEEIARAYAEFTAGAGGDTKENQDAARTFLESRGIAAPTIEQAYSAYTGPTSEQIANTPGMGAQGIGVTGAVIPSEAELFQAQTDAMLRADEEAFARSRAEIEALTRQEQETIRQQTAEYQAAQERLQAEAQAQAQQQAMEQAIIQKQLADIQAQQAAEAAKFKEGMEGMQRTSAQKQAASRKAGRSAGARPLLGAATPDSMGQGGQSLGSDTSLSGQAGSLGAQQTLGVGA
jgi:membrane protein involved in colicin uptake